jgi:ubiquitin-conjugating enzyme E2 G1
LRLPHRAYSDHNLYTREQNMASSSAAAGLLSRQLKQMQNDKSISGISCGLVESNVFEWEVMLMIDDDTKFYGGT